MDSLFLIVGLLAGYWAKEVITMLKDIRTKQAENKEYSKAGVVRPGSKVVRQVDLTVSQTGGVRQPSPEAILIANMKARDEKLKKMY